MAPALSHGGCPPATPGDNLAMNRAHDPDRSPHPYQALTPDVVLDALASVGLLGDGRLTALGSYENRVYQVPLETPHAGHSVVVAKFYRPGRWSEAAIREEHAFAGELADAEVPVVAPLTLGESTLHWWNGFWFSVSPWRGGRQPELDDYDVLEWIGRFLARIHEVGAREPFSARPTLNIAEFAIEPRNWLLGHELVPADVRASWTTACEEAIALIAKSNVSMLGTSRFESEIRLHGDCHPGNILWTPHDRPGGGPHFVDLDDARMGPAIQDLWMLLSGDRQQRTIQLSILLEGYEQFRPFNRREIALIEPLRTLRIIHYSAWLARRWEDPTFPIHFPWFGSSDYWRGQVHLLQEQIEALQEPPLDCG